MEIALIAAGALASAVCYKWGHKRGKDQGNEIGYANGLKKAEELALAKYKNGRFDAKSFSGVKHRLYQSQPEREVAWLG